MCGIAGYAYALDGAGSPVGAAEGPVLDAMGAMIAHRGPDDAAHALPAPGIGLAFRRLAIIDVATGRQPMANEDGSVVIVFNGEIYNHHELRPLLEQAGHRFRTRASDTEVLVHGYEQWGAQGLLARVRGMFAFAIWDGRQRRIVVARDRPGKKPLYYAHDPAGRFAFASEIKALRPLPWWSRDLDETALWHYLTLQYVPDPLSIHKGVRKLPPAHFLTWDQATGAIAIERYWELRYEPKASLAPDDARAQCEALIDEAVRIRLESEVPLGVFLSGGIDSSAVVAFMRRHVTGRLRTFSIGFEEKHYNELPHARIIADRFGTEHEEFIVTPDAADVLPTLAHHFDEPFADAAALPTWYLCRMARRHVTVALNGDGGDESFAGYTRTYGYAPVPWWPRLGAPVHMVAGALLRLTEPLEATIPVLASARYVNNLARLDPERNYAESMVFMTAEQKLRVASKALAGRLGAIDTSHAVTIAAMGSGGAQGIRDRFLASDWNTYLPGALLPKVDRTSMGVGLEARSPFLDHKLAEFAATLPPSIKTPGNDTKWFLKQVLAPHLPHDILHRPKAGFALPYRDWLRGPLQPMVRDLLLDARARQRGLFDPAAVERFVQQHTSGLANHKRVLWVLLNFELWARAHLDASSAPAPR